MNSARHITFSKKIEYLFPILLLMGIMIAACPAEANNLLTTQPIIELPGFKEGAPILADLLPRVIGLSKRRVDLEKMLMALPDMANVQESLIRIQDQIQSNEKQLETLKTLRISAKRQLAGINAELQNEAAEFKKTIKQLTHTFAELETYRQFWTHEKRQWESWQSYLPERDRQRLGLDPLFAAARENYDSALDMIAEAREQFLSIHRLAIDIQKGISALDMNIARTREQWKADMSHRSISPPPWFHGDISNSITASCWKNLNGGGRASPCPD